MSLDRRPRAVLSCDRLEDRNPASTSLDVLLADALLSAWSGSTPTVPAWDETWVVTGRVRPLPGGPESFGMSFPWGDEVFVGAAAVPTPEPAADLPRGVGIDDPLTTNPADAKPFIAFGAASGFDNAAESRFDGTPVADPSQQDRTAKLAPAAPQADGEDGGGPTMYGPNDPGNPVSVTMTVEDDGYVPVNANNTNNSAWTADKAGKSLKGLPTLRDFNQYPMVDFNKWDHHSTPWIYSSSPISDPELKKVTVTGAQTLGTVYAQNIAISLTYAGDTNARLDLYKTRAKEDKIAMALVGNPPPGQPKTYASQYSIQDSTFTFYMEGLEPSVRENDITLKVTYSVMYTPGMPIPPTPYSADATKSITVTPIMSRFVVNPKNPPRTEFRTTPGGTPVGITTGTPSGPGGSETTPGATFLADVFRKNLAGNAIYINVITAVAHTAPADVIFLNGQTGNLVLEKTYNNVLVTESTPILDKAATQPNGSVPGEETEIPDYDGYFTYTSPPGADTQSLVAFDTPGFGYGGYQNTQSHDFTLKFTLYLVWRYTDQTLYTLGSVDWQAVFKVHRINGVLEIHNTSITSSMPNVKSHEPPLKVRGHIFNDYFDFTDRCAKAVELS